MRKIKKEKKKVEVEKEVVISDTLHCDVCDKEIKKGHWLLTCNCLNNDPFISQDICSKSCLNSMLDAYIRACSKDNTGGLLFEVLYVPAKEGDK